ncbi:MAG: metallopeptidase family protein [Gemmatimonadetes bacterium]|nr:metallopeptidase family protein [Gemmatimonadota bacterium]
MRFADFEALIRRLAAEVPAEFLEGVAGIEVLPKALPHPERAEIYTLGECIPLPVEGGRDSEVESRVVLYHGSFQALARLQPEFDWRAEAWETLTHELRHHLEWRARVPDLEAFDWAAEQNFARMDGAPFDPDFPLSAERAGEGVFRLDDDFFLDRPVRRPAGRGGVRLARHGVRRGRPGRGAPPGAPDGGGRGRRAAPGGVGDPVAAAARAPRPLPAAAAPVPRRGAGPCRPGPRGAIFSRRGVSPPKETKCAQRYWPWRPPCCSRPRWPGRPPPPRTGSAW